ncbi:MAG: lamin tail domain-containing protein [Planctomycetes bacterium]|nr:lamin tail domain-containing protein [Planctomycetota bacterium]
MLWKPPLLLFTQLCLSLVLGGIPPLAARETWARGEDGIIFSEVHYHPLGGEAEEEFLELCNSGFHWVDIGGWRLEGGVEFTFGAAEVLAPGEFLAVARSAGSIRARAPRARVAGDFKGRLGDSGEILILRNRTGRCVAWLHYRDGRGRLGGLWPRRADGQGPSLELIGAPIDWDQAWYWRPSFRLGGTPGEPSSVTPAAGPLARGSSSASGSPSGRSSSSSWDEHPARQLRLNEAAGGEGAFVELINTGGETARLDGIRLEVHGAKAAAVGLSGRVSAGRLSIASGAAVAELLAAGGEHLLLLSAEGQLIDSLPAGEKLSRRSAGRFPDGSRQVCWYRSPSKGRSNPPPDVRKVVINEIHYHGTDPDGADEFVEIHNADKDEVALGGWRIDGAVEFRFPDGASLERGGCLVVARDPEKLMSRPAVAAGGGRILGPFKGRLSNRGDDLALEDADGNEVDRVVYEDRPPWPRDADGKGFSLELLDPGLDNSWAQAWTLGPPGGSPGRRNARAREDSPPAVVSVYHDPPLPAPGDAVTIHACVLSSRPLREVQILYYQMLADGRRSQVEKRAMSDRGNQDDGLAGDGHYTCRLRLPSRFPRDALLGYRIRARDAGGGDVQAPPGDDDFLCAVDVPDERFPDLPCYRIAMAPARWQEFHGMKRKEKTTWFPCTFIPVIRGSGVNEDRGRVYHGAAIRYRGRTSLRPKDGRYSYRLRLAPGDTYGGHDRLILNAYDSYRQKAGADLLRLAGVPVPRARTIRLKTPGFDDERYVSVEVVDSEFIEDKLGDASGLLFRGDNETGAPSDLSDHGEDLAYYRRAYRQMNHGSRDDLGRLPGLLQALASPSDEGYRARIEPYVDIEEWVTYFAANNVMGNAEGGLILDHGDDYYLAERPEDGRFLLIPWDHDSTFSDPRMPLFRPTIAAVRKFLRHPAIAPLFHLRVREIIDGPMSAASVSPRLASLERAFRGEDLARLRRFVESRQRFLREQHHPWPHAAIEDGSGLAAGEPGGFGARVFIPAGARRVSLWGQADPALTWSVRLNGSAADYDPVRARWKADVDIAGVGEDLWLELLGPDLALNAAHSLRIEQVERAARVEGALARQGEWSAAGGPYHLAGEVVVPAGSALKIGPGTEILCAPGARLVVRGALMVEGSAGEPVFFRIADGARPWRGISIEEPAAVGGGAVESRVAHCRFEGGAAGDEGASGGEELQKPAFLQVESGRLSLEHTLIRGVRGVALGLRSGVLHARACRIADGRSGVAATGGELLLDSCSFARLHGWGLWARGMRGARIVSCVFRGVGAEAVRVEGGALAIAGGSISSSEIGLRLGGSCRVTAEDLVVAGNAFGAVIDRSILAAGDAGGPAGSELEARRSVFCPNAVEFLAAAASRIDLADCRLLHPEELPPRSRAQDIATGIPRFRDPIRGDFRILDAGASAGVADRTRPAP